MKGKEVWVDGCVSYMYERGGSTQVVGHVQDRLIYGVIQGVVPWTLCVHQQGW